MIDATVNDTWELFEEHVIVRLMMELLLVENIANNDGDASDRTEFMESK